LGVFAFLAQKVHAFYPVPDVMQVEEQLALIEELTRQLNVVFVVFRK
jgi:hypothetical protein